MKKLSPYLSFMLVFVMLLTLAGAPAAAKDVSPQNAQADEGSGNGSYLLLLDMPDYENVDIPAGLTREQAARQANKLVSQQANSLQNELEGLQARGEITAFTIQPESYGVSIQLPAGSEGVPTGLQELNGIQEMASASNAAAACGASRLAQVQQQVYIISQAKATQLQSAATDPIIMAYAPIDSDWTNVQGTTQPNIPVSFKLFRGSALVYSETTYSYSDGWYGFYPDWSGSCSTGVYTWRLMAGDIVQVSAHGSTVSLTVAPISAWADPATNLVMGTTNAYQAIEVDLYTAQIGSLCYRYGYYKTTTAAANGSFQVNYTGMVDFFNSAYFSVYAVDTNGNATYTSGQAYSIIVYSTYTNEVDGYLKPNIEAVVTLTRNAVVLETINTKTYQDGYFYVYFSNSLQAGDVLKANGGGATASYTIVPLVVSSNPAINQVSGTTSAGRPVQLYLEKSYVGGSTYDIPTSCSYTSECKSLFAGGDGSFSATAGFDLERADPVDIYIYDANGNYQYQFYVVPAIAVNKTWSEAFGYWATGNTYLTISLMDAAYNLLDTKNAYSSSWNNYYYTYFSTPVQPGYHIQVTDSTITENMTVQNMTAELNSQTDHLVGTSAAGKLLAVLEDVQPPYGYVYYSCAVKNHLGGGYDFNFTGAGIEAQDFGEVYLTGSDGHYTIGYSHAFFVYIAYTYGYVEGYVPTPNASVTVEWLTNAGAILETHTWSTYSSGYYGNYLNNYPFLPGQRIRVTSGIYQVDITLPNLTINTDVAQNRYYGVSVPSSINQVEIRQMYYCFGTCWNYTRKLAYADGAGNYSASFNNEIYDDCTPIKVGNPCAQGRVIYDRPDEHELVYWTPYPSSVTADSYEPDDTSAAAKAYTGPSNHTFHVSSDVDWIKFTVTPQDLGTQFKLRTFALGATNDTLMELYDTDGTTLLLSNDDLAPGVYDSQITWAPSVAGTYYVKIMPYSSSSTSNCGAYYSFLITTKEFFLPVTRR